MHGRSGALEKLKLNTGFIPHPPTSNLNSAGHGAHWHVLLEYAILSVYSLTRRLEGPLEVPAAALPGSTPTVGPTRARTSR